MPAFDPGALLAAIVSAPGALFLLLAGCWMLGWQPRERVVATLTGVTFLSMCLGIATLALLLGMEGRDSLPVDLGFWYTAGAYRFPLTLLADRLSMPMMALTAVLAGLVGSFSRRYMHRERGFFRFFLLLDLFAFGAMLAFSAGSLDLLIGGWELVGISSVLLIAFFQERQGPVRNAIRTFGYYRVADLGLLIGVIALHHAAGVTEYEKLFRGEWPHQSLGIAVGPATAIGLLLMMAACGKSAQVPFCSWLPRAMEGPTPSSAIFYGAISVHMGAYLLLRIQPVLASGWAAAATVVVGLLTAFLGTLSHRVSTDAKTSLAYASMTQLGIIFMEIGLGFDYLAMMHIVGHALVRTLQFLRAPSMLHDYHRMHAAAGGELAETGLHLERWIPRPVQMWLYRFGLERGFLDSIIERAVTGPVLRLSRALGALEQSRSAPAAARRPAVRASGEMAGGLDA